MSDDERIMKNPSTWTMWPRLPIKNPRERQGGFPTGFPRLGYLAEYGKEIRFVEGNLFETTLEDVLNAKKADIDALLAAGWIVD